MGIYSPPTDTGVEDLWMACEASHSPAAPRGPEYHFQGPLEKWEEIIVDLLNNINLVDTSNQPRHGGLVGTLGSDHGRTHLVLATIFFLEGGSRSVGCETKNSQCNYPPQGLQLQDDSTTTFVTLKATCVELEATKCHWHDWVNDRACHLAKQVSFIGMRASACNALYMFCQRWILQCKRFRLANRSSPN